MRKGLSYFLILMLLYSCSADSDLDEILAPGTSIKLLFPENLSECTEGISLSETENELTFRWEDINNVDVYEMTLVNLNNSESQTLESKESEIAVILKKSTPYSWIITSASKPKKIRSETWFFFNEGPGVETFVPSPARALSPVSGASISSTSTVVNLRWESEDIDNDIVSYDLFFGENENPPLLESNLENDQYNNIPVSTGKIYYWKIITKDSHGNASTSPTFYFSVG